MYHSCALHRHHAPARTSVVTVTQQAVARRRRCRRGPGKTALLAQSGDTTGQAFNRATGASLRIRRNVRADVNITAKPRRA